jgi:hypothetical protein
MEMSNKPERIGSTKEEITKFLDEWEEKMWVDLEQRHGRSLPRPDRLKPKLEAKVLEFPAKLSEHELIRRQLIIDQTWERVLEQRRELERLRTCHRGPEDSDYNL